MGGHEAVEAVQALQLGQILLARLQNGFFFKGKTRMRRFQTNFIIDINTEQQTSII